MKLFFSIAILANFGMASLAQAQGLGVASIEAFLVYGQSGKLSPNIAPPAKEIDFWNTMIGEGGAGEWSEDVLVVARFDKGSHDGVSATISFSVKNHDNGKIILKQRNAVVSFAEGKSAAKSFLLEGVQCTNLDITVKAGTASKTINLPFACGE